MRFLRRLLLTVGLALLATAAVSAAMWHAFPVTPPKGDIALTEGSVPQKA